MRYTSFVLCCCIALLPLFAPVATAEISESDPFPGPFCPVGTDNLLQNGDFVVQYDISEAQKSLFDKNRFQVTGGKLPENWTASTTWIWAAGTFTLHEMIRCDGQKGFYASMDMETPHNKWNNFEFTGKQKIPAAPLRNASYYIGFWGRGTGTIKLSLREFCGDKLVGVTDEAFLLTDEWKFYRTAYRPKMADSEEVTFSFSPYGRVALAMPELAKLPAVDHSAELTFYVPFDDGTPNALYSAGGTEVFGPGEPRKNIPGLAGGAWRADRKRYMTESGFLRVPGGLHYESMRKVLDRNEGTIEFWFYPLKEMLQPQKWNPFYLMVIGQGSAKGGRDFSCYFERDMKGINLVMIEGVRMKEWPTRKEVPLLPLQTVRRYHIKDAEAFVATGWQHFAFTYDNKERVVYLNGKAVITFPALKTPSLMTNDRIALTSSHMSAPDMASCDFDEFRIYRGVRYHGAFTPSRSPLTFRTAAPKAIQEAPTQNKVLTVGAPKLLQEGRQLLYPLQFGEEKYRLLLSLGDGYPLIFSSQNAARTVKAPYMPVLPDLVLGEVKLEGNQVSGTVPRRDTTFRWSVKPGKDSLELSLELDKPAGYWTAYLEPRIILQKEGAWGEHYDGFGTRSVLDPFRPFGYDSILIGLPVSAAWNGKSGMLLGLSPDTFVSYLRRGMTQPDSLELAFRTVLDKGNKMCYDFTLLPFDAKYGANSALDVYQAKYPSVFRRDPKADPRVYGNIAIANIWQTPSYAKRIKKFSLQEINRRCRGTWCWYYSSGTSTGNWEPDLEIMSEFAQLNAPFVGHADFYENAHKSQNYANINKNGVNPAPYISQWTDSRFTKFFQDSIMDDRDNVLNGVDYIPGYWERGITDHIAIQSGTSYGEWLRKQIRGFF